jgi:hypothetical protein
MDESNQNHERHETNRDHVRATQGPYWKRAHHDWRFWAALLLMIAAMIVYVMSEDLSLRPRSHPPASPAGISGK